MELIRKIAEDAKKGPSKANNEKKQKDKKVSTPPKNKSKIAQKEKLHDKVDLSKTMTKRPTKSTVAKSVDAKYAKPKKNDVKKKVEEKAKEEPKKKKEVKPKEEPKKKKEDEKAKKEKDGKKKSIVSVKKDDDKSKKEVKKKEDN